MLPLDVHETLLVVQEANGGVLTRADLTSAGLGAYGIRRAVRQGAIRRVHRDAYRVPSPDEGRHADFRTAVEAVRRRQGDRTLTGPAALAVHRLPLFDAPRLVHVTVDARGGASQRSATSTVAEPPADQLVATASGAVANPARAVLDTARLHSLTAGVIAADAALRMGLCTPAELDRVVATMRGLRGVEAARTCAALASCESESPGESWSVVVMHRHGIPAPRRQQRFEDADGVLRTDFWWPRQRVVGEFDGKVKYGRLNPAGGLPEDVLWTEKRREDRLRRQVAGLSRWTTADLVAPGAWLAHLRSLLEP